MVNVGGTECMCGGTHVKNTADIRTFTATKIKKVNYTRVQGYKGRQATIMTCACI